MKDQRARAYFLCIFAYFTIGCMVLTANTVLRSILGEFSWTDAQGGLMISCLSLGNLIMSLCGNLLIAKLGSKRMFRLMSGVIVFSFGLFALLPDPAAFYPLMLLAGLAWGGVNSTCNTVVSDLYDGNASRLNVMNAFYAVGAVLFPLLIGALTMGGISWRVPAGLVAALGGALLLLTFLLPLPQQRATADACQPTAAYPFWREKRFYIGMLAFATYVGVETSACTWLSSWLSRSNAFFVSVPSETMVALMWLTMLLGRLLFAAIGTRINKSTLLLCESLGFLVGMLGVILLVSSTPLAILSVAFMGLSMSAIYGTTVANNAHYLAVSTVAPGILFACGGLGSTVVPWLAGAVSDAAGLKWGMLSLCLFLVLLVFASLYTFAADKSSRAVDR